MWGLLTGALPAFWRTDSGESDKHRVGRPDSLSSADVVTGLARWIRLGIAQENPSGHLKRVPVGFFMTNSPGIRCFATPLHDLVPVKRTAHNARRRTFRHVGGASRWLSVDCREGEQVRTREIPAKMVPSLIPQPLLSPVRRFTSPKSGRLRWLVCRQLNGASQGDLMETLTRIHPVWLIQAIASHMARLARETLLWLDMRAACVRRRATR